MPLKAPYPPLIVFTAGELAIGKLMNGSASKSLGDMVDAATKRLVKWAAGVPLRGANTSQQAPANLAVSSVCAPMFDAQGWRRFGGL